MSDEFFMISQDISLCKIAAQRFALAAGGLGRTRFESRKSSKPEKYLKVAQTPTRPLHAVLGNLLADQNDGRKKTQPRTDPTFTQNLFFGND
jgi:hypothetical protein